MFKWFIALFFIQSGFCYEFETVGDFSAFDEKPVVALWRGTHFTPTHYPDKRSQRRYMQHHGVEVPIYSAAVHRKTQVGYDQALSDLNLKAMDLEVEALRKTFKGFEDSLQITIDKRTYNNRRDAFQQIYANSTTFISGLGSTALPTQYKKYKPMTSKLPKGNPLISFSSDIRHAAKYGYGLKDYGHLQELGPLYDEKGKRSMRYIGFLQGVFMTDHAAKRSMPYDVVLHHKADDINVKTHFSNNILSEHEVSCVGKVAGPNVVVTLPLKVPDFSGPYPGHYREEFGLTKRKYDNISNMLTDPNVTQEKKDARIQKMLNEIIYPTNQDNGLVYKYTLCHRAEDIFLDMPGCDEFVPGVIDLNGRVRAKD